MGFRQYLLRQKIVTISHIHTAAMTQEKEPHKKIGQILCDKGFLKDEDLLKILEDYTNIPAFPGLQKNISQDLPPLEESEDFVPFSVDEKGIHVAMLDAENIILRDRLKIKYKRPVFAYHITEKLLAELREDLRTHNVHPITIEQVHDEYTLNGILDKALRLEASDIHFQPTSTHFVVRLRIDGLLSLFYEGPLDEWSRLLSQIKILAGMDVASTRIPQHGRLNYSFSGRKVDCRLSSHPTITGENVVIRLLDTKKSLLFLDELGFSRENTALLRSLLRMQHGLILFTGPTGSGKTTSLYALLSEMDAKTRHIVTLEQPVEYSISGIRQSEITQNMSFREGIRSLLRQDPDVMLIGEIRDEETAEMAFRASMTGHLVLSTMHTHDVFSAPHRLMNLGIEKDVIISQVLAVISQRLVRRLCMTCHGGENGIKGGQCTTCYGRGFKGRLSLFEGVVFGSTLRQSMMKDNSFYPLYNVAHKTLWDDGDQKIKDGLTTRDEVNRVLGPREF